MSADDLGSSILCSGHPGGIVVIADVPTCHRYILQHRNGGSYPVWVWSGHSMTPPGVTPDYWVWCDCDFGNYYPKPQADHTGLPEYLRELASRVEAGEIVHANVALHLQPKERYGMHKTQARHPETGQTMGSVPRVDAPIKDTAGLQVS